MKLFWNFCKDRRWRLCGAALCILLSGAVYFLYQLPPLPYFYALALCLFVGAVGFFSGFAAYCRRHRDLLLIGDQLDSGLEYLPPAHDLIEADYQSALSRAAGCLRQEKDQSAAREQDTLDYYTLWVHQVKIPISALELMMGRDTEEHRAMREELFRVRQYTEMALCYARLGSGSSDYVIRECDLDGILRQALRKFGPQFIRRRLRLEYESLNCKILTDEKWFLFVVEQVLSNALKYTRSGSVTISLALPEILSIRDTGLGIAPEDLPRIFDRGYTGKNGRVDKSSTGIGLYLCRRICENLGHRVTALSQVGVGTEIRIDFHRRDLGFD